MNQPNVRAAIFVFVLCVNGLYAANPTPQTSEISDSQRNWIFGVNIAYSPRSISGSIQDDPAGPNNYLATTDTLGLGTSDSVQYMITAKHKLWTFGLNYSPVSFTGSGYGYDLRSNGGPGVVGQVKLNTKANVDLLLGNVLYDVVHEENMKLALGGGFGQTAVDFALTPEISSERGLIYNDTTPFAFMTLNMSNRFHRFLYGANINGIGFTYEGFSLDYSDIFFNFGYTLMTKPYPLNLIGGYRQTNFDLKSTYEGTTYVTNFQMTGPYLGLNLIF